MKKATIENIVNILSENKKYLLSIDKEETSIIKTALSTLKNKPKFYNPKIDHLINVLDEIIYSTPPPKSKLNGSYQTPNLCKECDD